MAKLIYSAIASADGYVEDASGAGVPQVPAYVSLITWISSGQCP